MTILAAYLILVEQIHCHHMARTFKLMVKMQQKYNKSVVILFQMCSEAVGWKVTYMSHSCVRM